MKHKHADLIHAYADGAKIQLKENGKWRDIGNPSFYEEYKYRIKPEPVVLYVNKYSGTIERDRFGSAHLTRESAESMQISKYYVRTIKLMEVEDE